ncbi:site-specific integrase [candidate division WOR-3 bacterium]|nr:site-specific integrase [candidate division WOR-3 bacterium]
MKLYLRNNGRWYVRFTLNGKSRMISTRETDYSHALQKLGKIVDNVAFNDALSINDKRVTTFSGLKSEYVPYAKDNKATSTSEREKYTMRTLSRAFGSRKLKEITVHEIERFMQRRRKDVKPESVNRELALLRHMLTKAVDWGYLKENPGKKVRPFKESSGRIRFLTDCERERLLDACKQSKNTLLYPIVLTALSTGMRKGEMQRLTWDDVNLPKGIITVKETKNNEIRHIPISKDLLPVLHGLHIERPHSRYVFSRPDGQAYGNWRRSFENACRQAGVENFRFHDLRHTFASYLGMSGRNAFEIKALTGHKTIAMVDRYTHIEDSKLRAAVDEIGAKLVQSEIRAVDNLTSNVDT